MHELGMVSRVLEIVVRKSEQLSVRPVCVQLLAGDDAGISDEALRFYWAELAAGTPAADAVLEVEHTPIGGLRLASMDVERPDGQLEGESPRQVGGTGTGGLIGSVAGRQTGAT